MKPPDASRLRAGSRLAGCRDLEALIFFIPFLVFDVFLDCVLVHRTYARAEVAPRPEVLPPLALPQFGKLVLQSA
jgi:hypothetical protein